jgi:bifunctional UDP-N-acetylglucosamine pyrophosphorylase/glucosamine-1-phosphate N-acetyltransferase
MSPTPTTKQLPTPAPPRVAVVLAAGKGTRMKSERPKVLHEAGGRPLLAWALDAARAAGCARILAVVGHAADDVRAAFAGAADVTWVEQRDQLGTGHALLQAEPHVPAEALALVLSGDVPLVRAETLRHLAEEAARGWGAMAVATLAEPGALGRVIADARGDLARIVEARDAGPEELAIRTVNAGLYALPAPAIFGFVHGLTPDNAQGELYLTDAVTAAARAGNRVALVELDDPDEALGVNDRLELARVHRLLVARKLRALALGGATFLDPDTTSLGHGIEVGHDSVVHASVTLSGTTRVGQGVTIHAGAWIRDSEIGDGAVIEPYSVLDGAVVGPGCRVGPFARLRPGAVLMERAKVGNFVEVKQSTLGAGAKANHLAYLGDATVGAGANIGAGAITCNYDGTAKHPTTIGERAFVGSDTMLVAPVTVGDDAVTAAGSVITQDVPAGALAVERTRQRTIPGWSKRHPRGGERP